MKLQYNDATLADTDDINVLVMALDGKVREIYPEQFETIDERWDIMDWFLKAPLDTCHAAKFHGQHVFTYEITEEEIKSWETPLPRVLALVR